jgi:YHS domain-containing protein
MNKKLINECNLDKTRVAVQGYSPVSYFESGNAERGNKEFAVEHDGVIYYLTSTEQMEKFKADPNKYVPAYGGWCAYGMAIEKKFPIDPNNFKVVDDRLFLFLKNKDVDALELWNKEDEGDFTRKADKYWESLTGEHDGDRRKDETGARKRAQV